MAISLSIWAEITTWSAPSRAARSATALDISLPVAAEASSTLET
jgi:hypothetical protein